MPRNAERGGKTKQRGKVGAGEREDFKRLVYNWPEVERVDGDERGEQHAGEVARGGLLAAFGKICRRDAMKRRRQQRQSAAEREQQGAWQCEWQVSGKLQKRFGIDQRERDGANAGERDQCDVDGAAAR